MEWREPVEAETLSWTERVNRDVINKLRSLSNDPESRSFGFSHGYLVVKSRSLTVVGNFLFFGLIYSSLIVILTSLIGPAHGPSIHFLHFHISRFAFQWILLIAGSSAMNVAFTLSRLSWPKRLLLDSIFVALIVIVPMVLFHWSFMGD